MKHTKHKMGFTLAEVLITLGIIGVVAALTLPPFVKNYQKKVFVTQLKKSYNTISRAAEQYLADSNAPNLVEAGLVPGEDGQETAEYFVEHYLKVAKKCGETPTPCFANKYKALDGKTYNISSWPVYAYEKQWGANGGTYYILADGTSIRVGGIWELTYTRMTRLQIIIDVNGDADPNVIGRDVFEFVIYNKGTVEAYNQYQDTPPTQRPYLNYCVGSWMPLSGCTTKIIHDNWEMKY